jgi:hypothetical protein
LLTVAGQFRLYEEVTSLCHKPRPASVQLPSDLWAEQHPGSLQPYRLKGDAGAHGRLREDHGHGLAGKGLEALVTLPELLLYL